MVAAEVGSLLAVEEVLLHLEAVEVVLMVRRVRLVLEVEVDHHRRSHSC